MNLQKITIPRELDLLIDEKIGDLVNRVTCQLFLSGGKFDYTPLGTGLLANIGDKFYILTAAHVAEEYDEGLYLMTPSGTFMRVLGDMKMTNYKKPPGFDVAFIKISKDFAKILSVEFKFITEYDIMLSHILLDAANYSVFGYPAKNVSKKKDHVATKASLYVVESANEKVYDYYEFDKNLFYILEFKGKGTMLQTGDKSQKLGKQSGLSGGGLWFMNVSKDEKENFEVEFKLIGIMTDERNGKYHCLVANKINVLISAIGHLDDNVAAIQLEEKYKTEIYIHNEKNNEG